jgi:hypothetical protein
VHLVHLQLVHIQHLHTVYIPAEDAVLPPVSTAPAFSAPLDFPLSWDTAIITTTTISSPTATITSTSAQATDHMFFTPWSGQVQYRRLMNTMYYADGEDVGSMGRARVSQDWVW